MRHGVSRALTSHVCESGVVLGLYVSLTQVPVIL